MRIAIHYGLWLLLTVPAMAQSPAPNLSQTGDYAASQNTPAAQQGFQILNVTAGVDVLYYPSALNTDWSDVKTGFGLDYTYGGSLRVDIRPIRRLALSLNGGYYGFQLNRQFVLGGASTGTLYSETQTFNQLPLRAGLKVYLTNQFYLMPEAGLTWISTKITTSTDHPTPGVNTEYHTRPLTVGAGVGLEIHTKSHLLFDISLHGQHQNVTDFSLTSLTQSYSKPLSLATLRLGIGLDAFER